jgi:hypothetical protein
LLLPVSGIVASSILLEKENMSTIGELNERCSSTHRMDVESCCTGSSSNTVGNLHVPDDDRSPRPAPSPIANQEEEMTPPIKKVDTKRPTKTNAMNYEPKRPLQIQSRSDNKKIDNFSWKMGNATPTSVSFYRNNVIQRESTDRVAVFDWDTSRRPLIAPFTSTKKGSIDQGSSITPDHDDHDDITCLASDNIRIAPLLPVSSKNNTLIIKDQSSIEGTTRETRIIRLETPVKKNSTRNQVQQHHPSPWKAHSQVEHGNDHDFFQSVLESPSRVDLPGLVTPPLLQRAISLVEDMHVTGDIMMGGIDLFSEMP